jgi:PAS domain S-box-containing protein
MLGYSEQELLGMRLSQQLYGNAPNGRELIDLLKRDRKLQAQEMLFDRRNGTQVRVRLSAYLTSDANGEPDQVEAYFEDLTEQSALEQQIRSVQKLEAVGRLAGGVAHDFNNILVVIKLSTEMMLGQIMPGSPLSRPLLQVSKAADRAAVLTRQMLAFSRRQMVPVRVLNINSVVSDTSHMLQRTMGEDVQLVTRLADDLANSRLDPDQLAQVVLNLAVNARDAMPTGGTLHIETSNAVLDDAYCRSHSPVQTGRYVMVAVSDTGTGIKKSDLPHIFDPFFTTKEVGKGTGLGLSIVYGIVKQSGGYIWVYSEAGRGTTFKLYFPATDCASGQALPPTDVTGQSAAGTILVVEDDGVIRSNVRECLQQLNYTVLEARSGDAALDVCERNHERIGLIMIDLVMPGMSGPELARILGKRFPGVPMLFTSGYTEEAATRNAALPPGNSFLPKPYSVAELSHAVQEALAKRSPDAVERSADDAVTAL